MQKLQLKLKNVPTDVFQVCSSTNLELNMVERPSVLGGSVKTELDCNNLEGNLRSQVDEFKTKTLVYVLSIEGKPLMPCKPAKARKLLKSNRAKVIKRYPFTIQLNFECENKVQPCTLGLDTGYGNIGFSATTEKSELISGVLILDGKTSERLKERKMYRVSRRSRHHWYREPRWLNRKRKESWLPPSVQRRYDTHLNLIKKLKNLLPINQVILEIAKFDIQKIENLGVEGIQYQQGSLYEYNNIRSYLLSREKGTCQLCLKKFKKGESTHVHHIKSRSEGGTNSIKNLAILHKECHKKLHKKGLKIKVSTKNYKPSTFMSIINKRFWNDIPNLKVTYGSNTSTKRNELDLPKSHVNDAFVVSGGTDQTRTKEFKIEQKHKHNRSLQLNRKGFKPSIRKERYPVQPKDLIKIDGSWRKVIGMQNKGFTVRVKDSNEKGYKTYNFFKFAEAQFMFGSLVWI